MAIDPQQAGSSLLPRRNPGLIQRFWQKWVAGEPTFGPQPASTETTQSGVVAQASDQVWDKYFNTDNTRLAVYAEVEEMDDSSEETSASLDIIADNATSSEDGQMMSFKVKAKDPRVQQILDDTIKRAKLHQKAYTWARSAIKYGDWFGELVVNADGEIVDVRMLHPSTMYRNQDRQGNLALGEPKYSNDNRCENKQGECAFEQHNPERDGQLIAAFYPFQIVHGRWNWDGFSAYGRSYLKVTRIIWKKIKAEEESLIIGRLTRAMLKLAFHVDTTGQNLTQKEATLKAFRSSVTNRSRVDGKTENPFSVMTDFYLSDENYRIGSQVVQSRTRVEAIDPHNEGLNQINDVEHFHRKMLATLRVPPAYLTFEKDVNAKSTVTMQDVQFVRVLRRLQQFEGHNLKQIFDTALILEGVEPDQEVNEYEIIWPKLSTTDAESKARAEFMEAQAIGILLGTSSLNQTPVVTPEWVLENVLDLEEDDLQKLLNDLDTVQSARVAQQVDQAKKLAKVQGKAAGPPAATNGTTNASDGKPTVTPTGASASAKQANGSNTARRPLRQEARVIAGGIADRVRVRLGPEFDKLDQGQKDLLQELNNLPVMATNGNGRHG